MQHSVNPDSRPLPPGWNQHYDSQKKTWYYICMNVRPPHVSSTHPLGPIREASPPIEEYSNPEIQNVIGPPEFASLSPSSPVQPRSPSVQSQPTGLSFAQQLYASSVKATSNSSLHSSSQESSATRPSHASLTSIPTPPNSPPPNATVRALTVLPAPGVTNSSTSHVNFDPSEFYGTSLSSHSQRHDSVHYSSRGAAPTHGSMSHTSPRRSHSYQLTTSPIQESFHPHPHRASTFSPGNLKPNGTPSFITTARPPTNLSTLGFQAAAASPPPPQPNTLAAPAPLFPSPPTTLNSLTSAALQAETYPVPPSAQTLLPPTPISPQFTQPNQSQASRSIQPPKGNETNPAFKQIGLAVGKLAFNVAGGAVKASLGLPQTGGGIGGAIGNVLVNGTLDGDVMGSFSTDLSSLGDQGTGFDASQIQAVIQGQPETDYQSAIDTLMQQQQQPQAAPGVNYQALINQLQQNQSIANPQQQHAAVYVPQSPNQTFSSNVQQPAQTVAQNPMSAYQNTYNTQIQALSSSEQQYQDALRVQMQQINAAAAHEVAQAQQNTQNILQAAYQQQQQQQQVQQMQQMQLQQQQQQQHLQQMQVAYSRPASQYPAVRQTGPRPVNQGPSGLNSLLTGVGSVLSSFAKATNSHNNAGGGDSYTSDPSVDAFGVYDSFTGMGSDATTDY